ncbi:MAG: SRPBCC family protein [Planctomycetaceae bacterium]
MVDIRWCDTTRGWLLTAEQELPVRRSVLFEFFSDAFQLEQLTPPWLNFRVLTKAPIKIQSGTLIDYRLKLHGIPIRWRTEISAWNPPESFTDRQLRGPYLLWEHLHTFTETASGTIVRDQVRYQVPGGALVNWLFVQRDVVRIFRFRQQRMRDLFAAGS